MKIINDIVTFFTPKIKNDIQIDLSTVKEPFRTFIDETIEEANDHNIKVILSKDRQIALDEEEGTHCNGYFCDETMTLVAACGQPFDAWFPVLIHESSHMDQWAEDSPAWVESAKTKVGVEIGLILDLWLHKYVESTQGQRLDFIAPIREVELDCERRTIQKIIDNNLPMDTEKYAQRASSYVHYYNMLGIVREWYKIGKEPYNIPEIVEKMPTDLDGDYSTTPIEIQELFLTHMFPHFRRMDFS